MSDGAPEQQNQVLWRLNNPSGDELKCEVHRTDTAVQLRFRSNAGILCESAPMNASSVESWTRVWRAYYLTSGWSDPDAARRRHHSRRAPAPAAPLRGHAADEDAARADTQSAPPVCTGAILRYWTLTDRDGALVACELVRTEIGLEVRCNGHPARAQLVHTMSEGLDLAHTWKSALQSGTGLHNHVGHASDFKRGLSRPGRIRRADAPMWRSQVG